MPNKPDAGDGTDPGEPESDGLGDLFGRRGRAGEGRGGRAGQGRGATSRSRNDVGDGG